MASSAPPDLRVLYRKLTTSPPAQLPRALPSLTNHILRCKTVLSASHDQRLKDNAPESSQLSNKLKASVTTLLNSRNPEARFASIALVKAIVDVGGWEILRGSEPWVRGLLSIVQKNDCLAAKELAVVTLTRIYSLLHSYQTLVREIATPTLSAFITACLQLVKSSQSALAIPQSLVEAVFTSLSHLIPLYSTTIRPFNAQIKSAARSYLSPTVCDDIFIPHSLRRPAARLVILTHCLAAKSGGVEEWNKTVDGILRQAHATGDQIFRAIEESWEGFSGQSRSRSDPSSEPCGGGSAADELPPWQGVSAGAERLVGLFGFLAECLRTPTKVAVGIPLAHIIDLVSRVCFISRQSPRTQTWDQSLQTNSTIGREEKDELWSVMPEIHVAALRLLVVLSQRIGQRLIPFLPDLVDLLVRVFRSEIGFYAIREAGYQLLEAALHLTGPTLSKPAVDMLDPIISACCRDLQEDAGLTKQIANPKTTEADPKKNGVTANADLFLQTRVEDSTDNIISLIPEHKRSATALLPTLLSQLPQGHLSPRTRGLVEQTAILTRNREAMLASVLNPRRDQRGRTRAGILPHLSQQYPRDQGLEILRTNLRTSTEGCSNDLQSELADHLPEGYNEDEIMQDGEPSHEEEITTASLAVPVDSAAQMTPIAIAKDPLKTSGTPNASITSVPQIPKEAATEPARPSSPPKRKLEDVQDPVSSKRKEVEAVDTPEEPAAGLMIPQPPPTNLSIQQNEEDDSDDQSVHLEMVLDDDEDDEE